MKKRLGRTINARAFGQGLKIIPEDEEEYRVVQRYLGELESSGVNVVYYSYSLPAERQLKVAVRGVPADTEPEAIMAELRDLGFEPEHAQPIRARKGRPGCIFLVILRRTPDLTPAIYNVKELLCIPGVTIESWRGKRGPAQCHRCQGYRHSSHQCNRALACVKCGEGHRTADCPLPKGATPKCANCKGAHPANHSTCPVLKEEARNKRAGTVAHTTRGMGNSNALWTSCQSG
ncbi:unnamed protein product [Pieris macdunnoughi]|uniref:Pre-C2HC domain-containing protein n=1 Tax=Pieris macdunnoughi TaxID=345717 RepID=A0A821XP33_9NEOP|nr:unnamed protein product [Pieris macdunnoughi]